MTPSPAPSPILDLGSLDPVRPILRIDGVDYRYRVDLDLMRLAQIEQVRAKLARMQAEAGDEADPARAQLLGDCISEGVVLVMFDEIPADVLGKINDVQRLAILDAFTRATLRATSQTASKARAAQQAGRSTSPRSSHASSASTARRTRRSG